MVYTHKTGGQIQINSNPELTEYILSSTKLRNKGSNLGNNLKVPFVGNKGGQLRASVEDSNAKGKL